MRSRLYLAVAGLILIAIPLLFFIGQFTSRDGLHSRWRSLGLGDFDANTNFIAFGIMVVGAILLIVHAVQNMKRMD
jgi:TRAP-type mannitol/chloroaromatic compound transport system permease large subunit